MNRNEDKYSIVIIEDGTEDYMIQCNYCGGSVVNGRIKDIIHHEKCSPPDPEWFKEDE